VIAGLISDTHGLLRPEALAALQGCDLILHAGDVGDPAILDRLRELAPVTAVRGNIDLGKWAGVLPLTAIVEAPHARLYLIHNLQDLAIDPAAEGCRIVIHGHSHKPGRTMRGEVAFLNPGSAGPRRFQLPVTVARLDLRSPEWIIDWIHLV
jgi:putative phosphoesterase